MKKIFTLLSVVALSFATVDAQSKISFESSESYTVGQLAGQQGWTTWGGLLDMDTYVTPTQYTDGVNSMYVESWMDVMDWCGIEKAVTPLTSNNYEISFDYQFEDVGGSDYEVDFYDPGTDYNTVAAVAIGWQNGAFKYADMGTLSFVTSSTMLTAGTWYNIKMVVDKLQSTISYYVDNNLIGTSPLGTTYQNVGVLDFTFDDFGTGFYVDNIKMNDLTLATAEGGKKKEAIVVYPNPTSDIIKIDSENKIKSVEVYDASGKLVLSTTSDFPEINIQHLQEGNYVVNVKTTTATLSKKIIKK